MQWTYDTRVQSLGRKDPLEKGMATHSSILAWRISWTEEPGGLESLWGHKEWSHFTCVQLCVTLWTITHQARLSMGFSKQEYWSGLPCPPSGDPPNPGMEHTPLMSSVLYTKRPMGSPSLHLELQIHWSYKTVSLISHFKSVIIITQLVMQETIILYSVLC